MQNTRQNTDAEYFINKIWSIMNHVRGNIALSEFFTSTLAILYAMHKGYGIRVYDNFHHFEFVLNDDKLYRDLISLVPDDKHLKKAMCHVIRELAFFDREELNAVYVELLRGLFDLVSSNTGREIGEFYTPSAITKLIAYIIDKEQCKNVFDPFCGTASIVHELSKYEGSPLFTGQEINYKTSIYARLNVEALYGYDKCIANVNSIRHWNNNSYDAVVSCPPIGLRLTQEELYEARHSTPECPCRSYEEIILTRPFYCNHAKLTVTLLSTGFCYRGNRGYNVRRDLVEQNLVDTIISLPENILYGTSIPIIILVCKFGRHQDEPIKFIHAEYYYIGDRRKRTFDYEGFVEMIEGNASDIAIVSRDEVRQYDYNLNPSLYHKMDFDLKDGQKIVRIEELISPVEGIRVPLSDVGKCVSTNSLSRDFIEVLLNNGKLSTPSEVGRNVNYRTIDASDEKYLFAYSNMVESRYGINTDGKGFAYPVDIRVFKVNENLVTPEYLAYTLINHKAMSKGRMPLSGYMMLPIVIDCLKSQKDIVAKIKQQYANYTREEQEADAKRLGVKQNISDMEHMLGTPKMKIDNIIEDLGDFMPSQSDYQDLVKALKDNVDYMFRLLHFNNASINTETLNVTPNNLHIFLDQYVKAWSNYGGNYFTLSIKNDLDIDVVLNFDKLLFTVMFDSILSNAVRHGFKKIKNFTPNNRVEISVSAELYNGKPYVILRISNNGNPMSSNFTIKDYITRGRYSAVSGRSGLGGHHVYQIIKAHNGFLNLDSNKVWNMVVEVLIPYKNVESDNLIEYEHECI
jgi:type I restriction enzyme M protein